MKLGFYLKSITGFIALVMSASLAFGQSTCTESTFSAKAGDLYLKAENEVINTKNYSAARNFITQLKQMDLNCYERGIVSRLEAGVLIGLGDYGGAARLFENNLNSGLIPASEKASTFRILADLYLQSDNYSKALDYSNRWIRAGGKPDRTQKYQLAVLNEKTKNYNEAIRWGEDIYRSEGINAKDDVVQLLFYLYQETGNSGKRAKLVEDMIRREPKSEKYWNILRGDLFQTDRLRGFQAYRAMYHAGLVKKSNELMQLVDLYNEFEIFFHGARLLEKEMNAGRLPKSFDNLKKLADLYQYSSEFKRSIPVLKEAAQQDPSGKTLERIARSYLDIEDWNEAEKYALQAINKGGLKSASQTWLMVGRARYNEDNRAGAREAFRKAGRAGADFIKYMKYEDTVACDTKINAVEQVVFTIRKDMKRCKEAKVLGGEQPESCLTNDARLVEEEAKLKEVSSCRGTS